MKTGRFLTAAMIVFALIVVPMAAYVGGYFWLQIASTSVGEGSVVRFYSHRWQADMFKPAAKVDSWLRGADVEALCLADELAE